MQRFLQFLAVLAVSTGATYAQMTPTAQQVIKYLGQQRINQCRIDAMNRRAYEDAQRILYQQQRRAQQNDEMYRGLELLLGR